MITADQARALDPAGKAKEDLERLEDLIKAAALLGQHKIRVPHDMTEHEGYKMWFKRPTVEQALKDAGFTITVEYVERQFVDLWIQVSWKAAA